MPEHDIKKAFEDIYEHTRWDSSESHSGPGSEVNATVHIRRELAIMFKQLHVKSLLDAGCGDFNWMHHMNLDGITYHGIDIVDALVKHNTQKYAADNIAFSVGDITQAPLPKVDLILCKDCLFHLPNGAIQRAINNFKQSGSTFLLTTHHSWFGLPSNQNIQPGNWRRLNLQQTPFNFCPPLWSIIEANGEPQGEDRVLALWPLEMLKQYPHRSSEP